MINNVTVIGSIVNEPRVNKSANGTTYVSTYIDSSRKYGDGQNTEVNRVPINLVGAQADKFLKDTIVGETILISGYFQSSTFKGNDGNEVTVYRVHAFSYEKIDIGQRKNNQHTQQRDQQQEQNSSEYVENIQEQNNADDQEMGYNEQHDRDFYQSRG